MHKINPHIFPLLPPDATTGQVSGRKVNECSMSSTQNADCGIIGSVTQGTLAQKFHVRPNTNLIEDCDMTLVNDEQDQEEFNGLPESSQEIILKSSKKLVLMKLEDQLQSNSDILDFPKITFLGTGSSVPSKYRNVSSILVENLPGKYIILDCGEGTVLQLHRMFGREKAMDVLTGLTAVYISHLHADHHLGLIQIIKERENAFCKKQETVKPLYLIAPSRISVFLCLYHAKFENILTDLVQIRNEHLLPFFPPNPNGIQPLRNEPGSPFLPNNPYSNKNVCASDNPVATQKLYPNILNSLLEAIGLSSLHTCRALHCPGAFSVKLNFEYQDGKQFKLVYTGDTRPTEQLVEFSLGADLLIHEATLEHYMLEDCKMKKHSTFTEAVETVKKANAKFAILTHFSQRYSKFPIFDEFENEGNVGCAWDFMSVSPKTFKYINCIYQAVNERFPEELQEMLTRKEGFCCKGQSTEKRINEQLGIDQGTVDNCNGSNKSKKQKLFSDPS